MFIVIGHPINHVRHYQGPLLRVHHIRITPKKYIYDSVLQTLPRHHIHQPPHGPPDSKTADKAGGQTQHSAHRGH